MDLVKMGCGPALIPACYKHFKISVDTLWRKRSKHAVLHHCLVTVNKSSPNVPKWKRRVVL